MPNKESGLLTPNDMKDAMRIPIKNSLNFEAEQIDFERLRNAQDAKTLKEVGEWLWKHYRDKTDMKMPDGYLGFDILASDLSALKRGELPE